jgi:hypothetical protein
MTHFQKLDASYNRGNKEWMKSFTNTIM